MKNGQFIFKNNSFDLLRLFSALMIALNHSLTHFFERVPHILRLFANSWIGLVCLFTLTGYLIPASLERSETRTEYLKKRFLRMYPELWLSLAVSLAVMLTVSAVCGIFYNAGDILSYLAAQATVFQFYVPDAVCRYGLGNPNGALWTIPVEVQIYILIMLFWKPLKKQPPAVWLVLIAASAAVNVCFDYMQPFLPPLVWGLLALSVVPYAYIFLIGMLCYRYRDIIINRLADAFWGILAVYICWFMLNFNFLHVSAGHYTDIVTGVLTALLTLSTGYRLGTHRLKYEISYGIYIYHMTAVNALLMLGFKEKPAAVFITLASASLAAFLSQLCLTRFKKARIRLQKH